MNRSIAVVENVNAGGSENSICATPTEEGRVLVGGASTTGKNIWRRAEPTERLIVALLLLAILSCTAPSSASATDSGEPEPDCRSRPSWCQPNFSCVPSACLASLRIQLDEAVANLAAARIRSRRFHADLACGPGIATALDKDFGLSTFPTPGACIVGLAIRLGR